MGGVIINVSKNGIGRTATGIYGTALFTGNGYAIGGGVQYATVYPLARIEDAEALGITLANDIDNDSLVWYHLSEHFRTAPGTKTYLYVTDPAGAANTLTLLLDKDSGPLPAVLRSINGAALLMGVWSNGIGMGAWADVITAIPKAQALAEAERTFNRPIDIIIEGSGYTGGSTAATDLRTANSASWVGLTIAQDRDITLLSGAWPYHAAVGTAVGVKAAGKVNRNIGKVAECNLQDTGLGRWVNPGLSSGVALSTLSDDPVSGDFKTYNQKGYIVPRTYNDFAGVYFDTDPTCDLLTSDFYRLANSHTYSKAHRLLYQALVPLINNDVEIDPDSGLLSPETCATYESAGNDALDQMLQVAEISGYATKCDPNQDVLNTETIVVDFEIVPTGNAGTITGNIKFVKKVTQ